MFINLIDYQYIYCNRYGEARRESGWLGGALGDRLQGGPSGRAGRSGQLRPHGALLLLLSLLIHYCYFNIINIIMLSDE